MLFKPNTQEELQKMNITAGNGKIYFNVVDPYGMDKLVMQVQVVKS